MVTTMRVMLADFLARDDIDERRLELIDGEVTEKVSPSWGRGRLAFVLAAELERYGIPSVEARAIIPGGRDRADSAPIPDLAFYRDNPPAMDDWMRRPPAVVVEVVPPRQSRQVARAKVELYRFFGVASVWVVDPEWRQVDIYELDERQTVSGAEAIESMAVPGFSLTVDELFRRAERR